MEELMEAVGIDRIMAEPIVRYRDEHGSFRSAEELHRVPGIVDKRYEQVLQAVNFPDGNGHGQEGEEDGSNGHRSSQAYATSGSRSSGRVEQQDEREEQEGEDSPGTRGSSRAQQTKAGQQSQKNRYG
jgi:competence ComEA-like helix-hairpin-helix protein